MARNTYIFLFSLLGGCAASPPSEQTKCLSTYGCLQGYVCTEGVCTATAVAGASGASNQGPPARSIQPANAECIVCSGDLDCSAVTPDTYCRLSDVSGHLAYCGLDCTAADACPMGTTCLPDRVGPNKTCVPRSGYCPSSGNPDPGSSGTAPGASGASGSSGVYSGNGASGECDVCTSDAICQAIVPNGYCLLSDPTGLVGYCGVDCSLGQECPPDSVCTKDRSDLFSTCVPLGGFCPVGGVSPPSGTDTPGDVECLACDSDATCQAFSSTSYCGLSDTTGKIGYCALDCSEGEPCPTGSACHKDSKDLFSTCVPLSGACPIGGSAAAN